MDSASAARRRWLRRLGAGTAAFCLLYVGGWLTGWYGGRLAVPVGDLANLLAASIGAVLALATARRLHGGARRAWRLLALGMTAWAVAEGTYGWYDIALHSDAPFPGPADIAYLLGYVLIGAALLIWPSAPSRSFSRLRWMVDGLLITGALLLVSWILVLNPSLKSAEGSNLPTLVIGLAYPIGDVVLIALGLSCLSRARLGGQLAVRLLVVAVLFTGVADGIYLVEELGNGYVEGSPVGLGWVLCYLLVGIAGLAYDPEVATDSEVPLRGLGLAAPYLAFAAAMPFIVWQQWHVGRLDAVTVGIAVTCTQGVCLRQWLTSRDNSALTTALAGRQAQLQNLALSDPLTGLPNRALLHDRITHGLAGREAAINAILLLDLDGFKEVNDTYGHAAGDELLIDVGSRVRHCVRPGDTVARMGGDEFAVVLAGPPSGLGAAAASPFTVAERICAELSGPYACTFGEIFLTGSIGVALVAPVADAPLISAAELLRNADLAMYRAKRNGGNRAWAYEPELHEAVVRRHALESDLRLALERGEFAVAYQPVVSLPSGRIVGVEALMRWNHPTRGSVPPLEFIAVAEASGQLAELDAWVLMQACGQVVAWRAAGYELGLAVNTSVRQVQSGGVLGTVRAALAETGLPAAVLSLEITETVLVEDTDRAMVVLEELRGLGVSVALDDFGTGYSSLSYLARLPVDRIKIDRSFITELGAEPRLGVLVETVVWMGQRLGLEIVAEGVETLTQVGLLEAMNCRLAQGFYFSRPLSAADLTAYLRDQALAPAQRRPPVHTGVLSKRST